jgi:hypothetical protein
MVGLFSPVFHHPIELPPAIGEIRKPRTAQQYCAQFSSSNEAARA